MPTALITGIGGQDGSYLAEQLLANGYRVAGLDREAPRVRLPGVEYELGDVCDASALRACFERVRPNEVYHLAGQSSVGQSFLEPALTFRLLSEGTLNVLEAARLLEPPPRVLVAGSAEVFGDTGGRAASEELPFRPTSPYGAGKAAASHLTAAYRASFGLFACVAHFFNHESPRRPERFVTRKIVRGACRIARGLERDLTLGDTSVVRDWGWAPEYMEAARRILLAPEASDFVIATGKSHSLADFVRRVFEVLKLDPERCVKRSDTLVRPSEIRAMHADPTRAAERLGWRATTGFDELAARLVEAELAALDAESSPA